MNALIFMALEMAKRGSTSQKIKQVTGLSNGQIARVRKLFNLPRSPMPTTVGNRKPEAEVCAIRAKKQSGESYATIAKSLNVSRQAVQKLLAIKGANLDRCERCHISRVVVPIFAHHLSYENDRYRSLCHACHKWHHTTGLPLDVYDAIFGTGWEARIRSGELKPT